MSDSQTLLLVLAIIYLSECAVWTHAHVIGFLTRDGRSWRWSQPGRWFGNRNGGLLFDHGLLPWGTLCLTQVWPLSLSPRGLYSEVSHALERDWRPEQPERFLSWDDVESVSTVGKVVHVNGAPLVRVGSPQVARRIDELIGRLKKKPESKREAVIERALADALDHEAAAARLDTLRRHSLSLQIWCTGLFALIFVLGPLAVWRRGWVATWLALLASLVLLVVGCVVSFWWTHRRVYPEAKGERRLQMLVMLLNPLAAIRAHDGLSRQLLWDFHPLAAARATGDGELFEGLARKLLLDLHHPLQPICEDASPEAAETEAWFRAKNRAALDTYVEGAEVDLSTLLAPAPPLDETCRVYCPRCECQFVRDETTCGNCGVTLLRYDTAPVA